MTEFALSLAFRAIMEIAGAVGRPAEEIDLNKLRLLTIEEKMALAEEAKKAVGQKIDELVSAH